jgi:hypothetical protein
MQDNRLHDKRKIRAGKNVKLPSVLLESGRLRLDRSRPRRSYVLLRRKGSQVKQ